MICRLNVYNSIDNLINKQIIMSPKQDFPISKYLKFRIIT